MPRGQKLGEVYVFWETKPRDWPSSLAREAVEAMNAATGKKKVARGLNKSPSLGRTPECTGKVLGSYSPEKRPSKGALLAEKKRTSGAPGRVF